MKKLLFILFVLPCLSWGAVSYSGITIYSVMTSGDTPPEITVSAGCMFTGVSFAQAKVAGLVTIGMNDSTNSVATTYNGYDPITQKALIMIPSQAFTLPSDGLTIAEFKTNIKNYLLRKFNAYADEIKARYLTATKGKGSLDLNGTLSPSFQVKNNEQSSSPSENVSSNFTNERIFWNENILALNDK